MARKTQQYRKPRPVKTDCPFCKKDALEPRYRDPDILKKYMTDRGRIIEKDQNGLCAKHQRRVTAEIKRARHLALLPFSAETR